MTFIKDLCEEMANQSVVTLPSNISRIRRSEPTSNCKAIYKIYKIRNENSCVFTKRLASQRRDVQKAQIELVIVYLTIYLDQ